MKSSVKNNLKHRIEQAEDYLDDHLENITNLTQLNPACADRHYVFMCHRWWNRTSRNGKPFTYRHSCRSTFCLSRLADVQNCVG